MSGAVEQARAEAVEAVAAVEATQANVAAQEAVEAAQRAQAAALEVEREAAVLVQQQSDTVRAEAAEVIAQSESEMTWLRQSMESLSSVVTSVSQRQETMAEQLSAVSAFLTRPEPQTEPEEQMEQEKQTEQEEPGAVTDPQEHQTEEEPPDPPEEKKQETVKRRHRPRY